MGKKVKEYKAGDFIFAKVKGYPAWPARIQKQNGKKYFVYFYGTGETANLPTTSIFDYETNKEKFLAKSVKRRDFNDGVTQIEYDFANNVPIEDVVGVPVVMPVEQAEDTLNDTENETLDETADTSAADETMEDTENTTTEAAEPPVEDSDDAGALVIDEGKQGKAKKGKDVKTPAKEPAKTPAKDKPAAKELKTPKAKEPKTPRGKARKEESAEEELEEKKEEEIVSRSGRKIRPKRYIDEQTEENTTLPSPAPKKRRGASPAGEKEKEVKEKAEGKEKSAETSIKQYNAVSQSELQDLKEPFKPADAEKENILITYLPSGQYIGIKLFQSRPSTFKSESSRLQWDKQAASNAITLKMQLERGQITPQSISAQLVMELNLSDEEKTALDKERETDEKKSRVQFLKTEMKLIELDAKVKTCLCLEKADTELCLKLLDELMELDIKPLMLLKHPTCLETVKRMRAYVGNTPRWRLNEAEALEFSKQAHSIRRAADHAYTELKGMFSTPDGVSFWEYFSDRVLQFKKATTKLNADELLELVHEPLEMSVPSSHTMKSAVDAANGEDPTPAEKEESPQKKAKTPAKAKKAVNNTPSKPALKRQSSRNKQEEPKEVEKEQKKSDEENDKANEVEKNADSNSDKKNKNKVDKSKTKASKSDKSKEEVEKNDKSKDKTEKADKSKEKTEKADKSKDTTEKADKLKDKTEKVDKSKEELEQGDKAKDKIEKADKTNDAADKSDINTDQQEVNDVEMTEKESEVNNDTDKIEKNESDENEPESTEKVETSANNDEEESKKVIKNGKAEEKADEKEGEEKKDADEPRAKRSRESKKTEPPTPRSPIKRKSKM